MRGMQATGGELQAEAKRISTVFGPSDSGTERHLLRLGAVSAFVGQLILLAASAVHPSREHPSDHTRVFQEYADSASWTSVHTFQWIGGVLGFLGLALLARHLVRRGLPGAVLARLAMAVLAVVAVVFTVLQAVDGVALKMAVDTWAAATGARRTAAFSAAEAVRWTEIGLNAFGRILQGLAIGLVAVSAFMGGFNRRLLVAGGVLAAAGGVAAGVATTYTGFSTAVAAIAMPPSIVQMFWMFTIAVVMWRAARADSV